MSQNAPHHRSPGPSFLALGILLLSAPPALADSPTLLLEEVLARARTSAPEVTLAQRAVEEAQATRVGQGVILPTNPRLFGDLRKGTTAASPSLGTSFGAEATVEVSGAASLRLAEADARLEVARRELDAQRRRASSTAWRAYVEAQVARAQLLEAVELLQVQERVVEASRARLAAGVAGEPEVAAVLVDRADAALRVEEARRAEHLARLALAQAIDLDAPPPSEAIPALEKEPAAPEPEAALVARARHKRADLAAIRARLAELDASDARLAREVVPRLGVNAFYDASPDSPPFAGLGLSVDLPVAQRNQGPRAVVDARRNTERERLELELRRVSRDVAAAHASVRARLDELKAISTEAVPAAERLRTLVEEGWRAGRFDVFRLTSATRDLQRTRRDRLDLLRLAWADRIELEALSGGLDQ